MNFASRTAVCAVLLLFVPLNHHVDAQNQRPGAVLWTDISEQDIAARLGANRSAAHRRDIVPHRYRTVHVNKAALKDLLATAVPESAAPSDVAGVTVDI